MREELKQLWEQYLQACDEQGQFTDRDSLDRFFLWLVKDEL